MVLKPHFLNRIIIVLVIETSLSEQKRILVIETLLSENKIALVI